MSLSATQKAPSRPTLVLWPPTLTVLLTTKDFPRGSLGRSGAVVTRGCMFAVITRRRRLSRWEGLRSDPPWPGLTRGGGRASIAVSCVNSILARRETGGPFLMARGAPWLAGFEPVVQIRNIRIEFAMSAFRNPQRLILAAARFQEDYSIE